MARKLSGPIWRMEEERRIEEERIMEEEKRKEEEKRMEAVRAERENRVFRVEKGDLRKSRFSSRKRRFARTRWFHVLVIINVIFDLETSHQTFKISEDYWT